LVACLLLTLAIIRYAPLGIQPTTQVPPSPAPAKATEELTLSFQDGVLPSKDYQGTRDTRLRERDASEDHGSEDVLEVDGESGGRPALLQWDLRQIPPGSRLISASLTLTITSVSRDREYEVFALSRPWIESQANWVEYSPGRKWEIPGGKGSKDRGAQVLARFRPQQGTLVIPLNGMGLTAVQRWINSTDTNHGLLLQGLDPAGEFSFRSRETGLPIDRPKLTVSYRLPPK